MLIHFQPLFAVSCPCPLSFAPSPVPKQQQSNSFEQFIINYCNEKLQQIFIELTLKQEQDEYVREGIPWTHVDYFNNAVICELIESRGGIMSVLDDMCLRPGDVTDQTFLDTLNRTPKIVNHKHFETRAKRQFLSDNTLGREQFRLVHYAGKVTYDVQGFISKNKDSLFTVGGGVLGRGRGLGGEGSGGDQWTGGG